MKNFRDSVAVITGGASGIGFAMAEKFIAEGMKVVVADIEIRALESAVDKLSINGAEVLGVQTDVSDAESVRRLAEETISAYGQVKIGRASCRERV